MRYKVGDEVVLRDGLMIQVIESETVVIDGINNKGDEYTVGGGGATWHFNDEHIDHEKTAELNKKEPLTLHETLDHYQKELETMKYRMDAVQPDHYRKGEYEAIDVIKDVTMDYSGYEGYLIGNIIKYLYRANYKGNKLEDLKKGQYYYNELIESLEESLDD